MNPRALAAACAVLTLAALPAMAEVRSGAATASKAAAGTVVQCPLQINVAPAAPAGWGFIARRGQAPSAPLTNGMIPAGGPLVCRYGLDELMLVRGGVGACQPKNPKEWATPGGTDTLQCITGAPQMPASTACAAICQ